MILFENCASMLFLVIQNLVSIPITYVCNSSQTQSINCLTVQQSIKQSNADTVRHLDSRVLDETNKGI